jgi:SAM-dependent methyltransferase
MMETRDFLNPVRSAGNLDTFGSRRAILNALTEQLANFHGTCLDVGCGRMPYRSLILAAPGTVKKYIGMDLRADLRHPAYVQLKAPDLEWDGRTIPLDTSTVDCTLATEVFQYFHDVERVMQEVIRVLKPDGLFFFTLPFLWPLHDSPSDQFRYTPFALERLLEQAGFCRIQMKAMGGWDASLAQMIGLWARRRPMNQQIRRIASILALPVVRYLQKKDKPPPVFADQQMITGISGTARKPAA